MTPESQFKVELLRLAEASVFDGSLALDLVLRSTRFRIWGFELSTDERRLLSGTSSPAEFLGALSRAYGAQAGIGREHATLWVDHTPDNVANVVRLLAEFPDARFVHVVRDGRGVAASLKGVDWGPATVSGAGQRWSQVLGQGLAAELSLPEGRIMRVHFETLLGDPQTTIRSICEFAGVEYTDAMCSPDGSGLPAYTRRQHKLVGRPLSASRVGAWKTVLTRREIEIYESVVGDLLPLMGYSLQHGVSARPQTRPERIHDSVRSMAIGADKRLRHFARRLSAVRRSKRMNGGR